ncbi:hypothetical protein ES703_86416 [subsurface metagenome]
MIRANVFIDGSLVIKGRFLPAGSPAIKDLKAGDTYTDCSGNLCTWSFEICPHGLDSLCSECSLLNYGRNCENRVVHEDGIPW